MGTTPRHPTRIPAYDSTESYYPREVVEENGKLYLIDGDTKTELCKASQTFTAQIGTTWTGDSYPYTQTISVDGIKGTDTPIVDLVPSSDDYDTTINEIDEYGKIYRITTADGSITVYSTEPTTLFLNIQLKCIY